MNSTKSIQIGLFSLTRDEAPTVISVSPLYRYQVFTITVLLPCLSFIAVLCSPWMWSIKSVDLILLTSMFTLNMIGMEVACHRYFSHHAFKTTRAMSAILAILGCMAAQGSPIYWASNHRRHHQYSDQASDPHSPHIYGKGLVNSLRGLWHAHIGWILTLEITNPVLFAKDLIRDPIVTKVSQLYFFWIFLGIAIPAIVEGFITKTWTGVLSGALWGGLIRIFLGQQMTYIVNSICHTFGDRPFKSDDQSTNNLWFAIPSFGASWHNNHHAFQSSAIAGLEWWQLDLSGWVIRGLEKLGLAWDVKVPTPAMIEAKKQP